MNTNQSHFSGCSAQVLGKHWHRGSVTARRPVTSSLIMLPMQRAGETALMLACSKGCQDVVSILLSKRHPRVNVNSISVGSTRVQVAVVLAVALLPTTSHDGVGPVKLSPPFLTWSHRYLNWQHGGDTALLIASSQEHSGIVQLLLKAPGLNVNDADVSPT